VHKFYLANLFYSHQIVTNSEFLSAKTCLIDDFHLGRTQLHTCGACGAYHYFDHEPVFPQHGLFSLSWTIERAIVAVMD
jgi:hypothetical protein